jgi:hypothetical protein
MVEVRELAQERTTPRCPDTKDIEDMPGADTGQRYSGPVDTHLTAHVEMVHRLAAPLGGKGVLIVAAFGQDPATGAALPSRIEHFQIGNVRGMVATITKLAQDRHRNVYVPLAVMRPDLKSGAKGTEADIVGVLGLVADFDDDNAADYARRLPVMAPYALETSPGRFQAFLPLDRPVSVADAKPVAQALKEFSRCDHGTADMSHVWRVPGTRNWPNKKKVDAGRDTKPQAVTVVEPWDSSVISLEEIRKVLPERQRTTEKIKDHFARLADPHDLPPGLIDRMNMAPPKGQRSELAFGVLCDLVERKWSDNDIFDEAQKYASGFGERYVGNEKMLRADIARARDKAKGDRRDTLRRQEAFRNGKANGSTGQNGQKTPGDDRKTGAGAPPDRIDGPEDVLRVFNRKYAVVNEAGKVVIYCPKRDDQLKRDTIERILFEDFRRMFMNQRIEVGISRKGNPIWSDISTVWLEHEKRRQYLGGVVMDPTNKAPPDCWNLWKGFNVAPRRGDWSLMRDHIRDVICNGDAALFEYVVGWLARMIQHPDQPGEVALVLRGKKGTGKGTLGNWLIRLLGQHGVHVAHAKHLVGTFNAHLRDAVFVFADEAFFAGDKAHEGVLKALVTEPFITIEAKYQNAVTIANMTHILMASNSDWVVPATSDERRFCVMDVSDSRMRDIPYFDAISKQMENGGLAAMLHDLLNRDLSDFNVREVPQTEALADQKRLSLDSLHRWWLTVLQRGFVWRSRYGAEIFTKWSEFVSTELLYRSYLQWCAETREGRPMGREQLGTMLKGIYPSHRPRGFHPVYEVEVIDNEERKPAVLQERPQGYRVGLLDRAQADFAEKTKIVFDWGSDEDGGNFL